MPIANVFPIDQAYKTYNDNEDKSTAFKHTKSPETQFPSASKQRTQWHTLHKSDDTSGLCMLILFLIPADTLYSSHVLLELPSIPQECPYAQTVYINLYSTQNSPYCLSTGLLQFSSEIKANLQTYKTWSTIASNAVHYSFVIVEASWTWYFWSLQPRPERTHHWEYSSRWYETQKVDHKSDVLERKIL